MAYNETQFQVLLTMLESNLDMDFTYMDAESRQQKETQLGYYLMASIEFIEREGITLNYDSIGDLLLVSMYAQFLYDKRFNGVSVMPRALRYNLNDRVFQEKVNNDG